MIVKDIYIAASQKPWHLDLFQASTASREEMWLYVSSPDELGEVLRMNKPRYIFFFHWSEMVPKEIWSTYECVCFHMTDVPYGRGGSPLQNLIIRGATATKVSALRMIEEVDAGPVYCKWPVKLNGRAEDIYIRIGELCWDMAFWMVDHRPVPNEQSGEITFFKRRNSEQSVLPKFGEIQSIFDHIRMVDAPTYPLAYLDYGEFRIEFSHAEFVGDEVSAQVSIHKKTKGKSNG